MHAAGFDLRANTVADCTDKAAQLEWLDPKLIWFVQGDTGDTERHVLCEMTVPPSSARHDHRRVRHKRGAVPRAAGLRHGPPRNPAPPRPPPGTARRGGRPPHCRASSLQWWTERDSPCAISFQSIRCLSAAAGPPRPPGRRRAPAAGDPPPPAPPLLREGEREERRGRGEGAGSALEPSVIKPEGTSQQRQRCRGLCCPPFSPLPCPPLAQQQLLCDAGAEGLAAERYLAALDAALPDS